MDLKKIKSDYQNSKAEIISAKGLSQKGNYYTCPATIHAKDNYSTVWSDDSQSFHCFDCGKNFDIIDLKGRDYFTEPPKFNQKQPISADCLHFEYLTHRNINRETSAVYAVNGDSSKITFNSYINNKIVKTKHVDYKRSNGKKKITAEKGGINCFFGLQAYTNQDTLVICEGEIDAMSAMQLTDNNVLCVSLPNGVNSLNKSLLELHMQFILGFKKVYTCFDNDDAGVQASKKAEKLKWKSLKIPKEYNDINEYLCSGKAKNLIQAPVVHTFSELSKKTLPPLHWAVDGLIHTGFTLFCGRSKVGKSFLLMRLFDCISGGDKFLDRDCEQGDVLFMSFEDSERRIQGRIEDMNLSNNVYYITVNDINRESSIADLIISYKDAYPNLRVICIDTVSILRKENSKNAYSDDVKFYSELMQIAHKLDICIIGVHHTNKTKESSLNDKFDAISGSMGTQGSVDTFILMGYNPDDPKQRVLNIKGKDVDEQTLTIAPDRYYNFHEVNPVENLPEKQEEIMGIFKNWGEPMTCKNVADALDMTINNVRQPIRALIKKGRLMQSGKTYQIAPNVDNFVNNFGGKND